MRFVTFEVGGSAGLGLLTPDGQHIVDLRPAEFNVPRTLLELVFECDAGMDRVREAANRAPRLPVVETTLRAPIPQPARNIFCVGKNYYEHAREFEGSGFDASSGGQAIPDAPIIFTKASTTVVGPGTPIQTGLDPTASVDYEGELTVVIGRSGRGISRDQAMDHVFGYTIINDVTARDLQKKHKQWFIGKNLDGFCPMGPTLVTADEVEDVSKLELITRVNDEVRQRASLADLIFDIPELIETLSRGMTLLPGDLIATGTPAGVGIGYDPPRYLKPGDDVRITIDPIGELHSPVA